jgi:hypothetical protein
MGLLGNVPNVVKNWHTLSPAEKGKSVFDAIMNTTLLSPLALGEAAFKTGLKAEDVLGRGQSKPLPTALPNLRNPSPAKDVTPATQPRFSPVASGESQPGTAASKPTGVVLSPEQQEMLTHKASLTSKSPDELRQMIATSKQQAPTLAKVNPLAAYKEVVFNQQFPREELQKRGEQPPLSLDEAQQVAHAFGRPSMSLKLALVNATKAGGLTKEQATTFDRKIADVGATLHQRARDGLLTKQDSDGFYKQLQQINTEVQNAIQKPSTGEVLQREQVKNGEAGSGRRGVEQVQQGQETAQESQGQKGQEGQGETAPKGQVSTGVRGLQGQTGRSVVGNDELSQGEKVDKTGEAGFTIAPREVWDTLFNNKASKIDPVQMLNRLRNKLGEGSATWKALQDIGLKAFLVSPKSTQEVEQWAESHAPKVEVRKFGEASV